MEVRHDTVWQMDRGGSEPKALPSISLRDAHVRGKGYYGTRKECADGANQGGTADRVFARSSLAEIISVEEFFVLEDKQMVLLTRRWRPLN